MIKRRVKVMFFAEAVTLAHLARPISLASSLDPSRYEVVMAADPRCRPFLGNKGWENVHINSLSSTEFLAALARGRPVYDHATLLAYVAEDIELLALHQPDIVVGDFRLSLSVSARLANIPYCTITNGYWSPSSPDPLPLPELPLTRWLPIPVADILFRTGLRYAMRSHCKPLNRIRREHGLTDLGADIRQLYTDADHVLRADAYPLVAEADLPSHHTHLGPLAWSPPVPEPAWWQALRADLPVVYVTLGSSGAPERLASILSALEKLPLQVVASTAGAPPPISLPANARVAKYLHGEVASGRASLVICNGGSPSTQQALSAGVPVLGLPSNMDQMFNMQSICKIGAGLSIRADRATERSIRAAAVELLASETHRSVAGRLAAQIRNAQPVADVFDRVADRLLGK